MSNALTRRRLLGTAADAQRRRAAAEAMGLFHTHEIYPARNAVMLIVDAMERAGSADKDAVNAAMAASTRAGHGIPCGPTRMADGRNRGAQPVDTQAPEGDIEVIHPAESASAQTVFPMPA